MNPASAGLKAAPTGVFSFTFKSIVVFSTVISVGIFLTVTFIVLFSAAAYLTFPLNETVIIASPSLTAIIWPNPTLAILELLEV